MNIDFNSLSEPTPKQALFTQMVQSAVGAYHSTITVWMLFQNALSSTTAFMLAAQSAYAVQLAATFDVERLSLEEMTQRATQLAEYVMRSRPEHRPDWMSAEISVEAPGTRSL